MNSLISYVKEAYNELKFKVTWPTWEELQNSTVVVMVASLMIAMVVWGMDEISRGILYQIYDIFDF